MRHHAGCFLQQEAAPKLMTFRYEVMNGVHIRYGEQFLENDHGTFETPILKFKKWKKWMCWDRRKGRLPQCFLIRLFEVIMKVKKTLYVKIARASVEKEQIK